MKASKNSVNRSNLVRRFSRITTLTFLILVFLVNILQYYFMDDFFLMASQMTMVRIAYNICDIDFEKKEYKSILADYEANHNVYIEIYSPRDVLFYTTESNKSVYEPGDEGNREELKPKIMKIISHRDLENGGYFEFRQEYYTTAQYIVYGMFFGENNGIEIYRSTDVIKENALTASWVVFGLTCGISGLVLLIALIYLNSVTKPLTIINSKAKKITNMDFSESCPSFKIKELNELSTNINMLSSSLSSALSELKSENIQLEKDIKQEKRMEKIMRSFIANVSHELKTPISIIQGYAEGMKYGIGCDSTEEFCDIIIEESNRMNNLVCRLMEYLHYGSEAYKSNPQNFNIAQFINDCVDMRRKKIDSIGAHLTVEVNESFEGNGDTDLLANVFNNYLSNALSHIDYEKELIISAKDSGNSYTVSVYNSGDLIHGTDIENIWQSFYRADKSHSREEGRFGLGLSIVATIQKLHNQKYGVINREKGVEFWFDIKKASQ